jgi:hypothetical protein
MKTRVITIALVTAVWCSARQNGQTQGTFQNLDFESPILPLIPEADFSVPIARALPGWTGYVRGGQVDRVIYNTISIDNAAISFHGPGSAWHPFHGDYMVHLQAGWDEGHANIVHSAIAQTGQIPSWAESLRFYAYNTTIEVSFAGRSLQVLLLTGGPYEYRQFGVNVGGVAGQTGELRFLSLGSGNLDYIQFSPSIIPEPSSVALLGAGVLLLGFCVLRRFAP